VRHTTEPLAMWKSCGDRAEHSAPTIASPMRHSDYIDDTLPSLPKVLTADENSFIINETTIKTLAK